MTLEWTELDQRAVTTAKLLAADAVEAAGSGHPGTPISLAAAAYLIFQKHLRFDPQDDLWLGRDKFVLSAGHASLLQYIQLYLAGMDLSLDDLKSFRKFGSKLPGHPEYRHTKGVEVTTGPLGTGLAAAIGFAMNARRLHGLFDPETKLGESPFDHYVYAVAGDGCLQEGIASEACSLAGTQKLGNLILLYDDNHISIEDDTQIAFNEDVLKRFEAYGWHTQRVNWLQEDGHYTEDVQGLDQALRVAKAETGRPSIIALRTIIGWPSPGLQNTGTIHGAKLGATHLAEFHRALGVETDELFQVDEEAVAYAQAQAQQRAEQAHQDWDPRFENWKTQHPDRYQLLQRLEKRELPADWDRNLPVFEPGTAVATRNASGKVIAAIGQALPEFWGGSADLAGSNKTVITGDKSFAPVEYSTKDWPADPYGRILHFGVREHGMGGVMNGIAIDGFTRVFGGTFFVFADFMRGAVRLAALMNLPVSYVWTHDSIGVGEDGPTHQPIEHLSAYRAIPNLAVVRPMDGNETAQAWKAMLEKNGPAGIVLSRQNLPTVAREDLPGAEDEALVCASATLTEKGAYILSDCEGDPEVILLGSGSEVQYALQAAQELRAEGIQARVVSVPCQEWFAQQPAEYQEAVLPSAVKARVSIEAGITDSWLRFVGSEGIALGIDRFGVPGAAAELFEHFQLSSAAVVQAAKQVLQR